MAETPMQWAAAVVRLLDERYRQDVCNVCGYPDWWVDNDCESCGCVPWVEAVHETGLRG